MKLILVGEPGNCVDGAWESPAALDRAETWVNDRSGTRSAEREQVIASNKAALNRLSSQIGAIRAVEQREAASTASANDLDRRLAELCDGTRVDDLEARLEAASAQLNKEEQLALARMAVAPLLGPDTRTCPMCGLGCNGAELLDRVTEDIQQANSAHERAAEEVQKLARRKEQAQGLAIQRDAATREAEIARGEYEKLVSEIEDELGCLGHAWERSAEARLTEFEGRLDDLQQEGKSATDQTAKRLQRIKALRDEWRYHQLRDEEHRLRRELNEDLQPARDRLRSLEDFRSTAVGLHKVLCEEFDAAVDRALPTVSDQLTEAFQRLTDHPAFDVLRVERADGPDKMLVRVGSTRAPVPWSRPEDVLNGGAYAALGLIPHLVFSGFHAEQTELNVLIVDDPSQSFDTTHVKLLLEELRRAGEHAQLLLATHEEERFLPIVRELFPHDSFTVIRVTDFRPDRGPTIEHG